MSKGWIKLDRQMTEHWLWKDKPFSYAQAWVDLLLKANHKPAKILIKNCLVELKRGDQARSERTLENDWGWSRGKVRRFLVLLKNDHMIEQRVVPVTSIITICNYDSFQGDSTTGSTSNSTSADTTGGPQAVHKQECKNENNDKNRPKELSPSALVGQEVFDHWKAVMNKNNSARLNKARANKIKARIKEGYSVDDMKLAIDGCANTPHNMGQNDRGELFNDLELICRDGSNLERFMGNVNRIPASTNQGPGLLDFAPPQEPDNFINHAPQGLIENDSQ